MIGAIGLAMSALSTVSSLVGEAAGSVGKAANGPPAQTFSARPGPGPQRSLNEALPNPGAPIPKFDKRTHAHLLALQEQHRGH
jgi:hypothetical protein